MPTRPNEFPFLVLTDVSGESVTIFCHHIEAIRTAQTRIPAPQIRARSIVYAVSGEEYSVQEDPDMVMRRFAKAIDQ